MKCPRRDELGAVHPFKLPDDDWQDRDGEQHCSYCGSLHPDRFLEMARSGVELVPTDKSYKVYVRGDRQRKFYFPHLSREQRQEFVDLNNGGSMNLAHPGRFYTLPFFCVRARDT